MGSVYDADFTEIYDIIYHSRGKNYSAEAEELARLIRARKPNAASVLDVACGTGGHLRFLGELFDRAAGIDLSEDMLAVAETRMPGIGLHRGDMRDFDLASTFDAIICMFSSIGYLRSTAELDKTLGCFAQHLNLGGVIAIEPWFFPDTFIPGHVSADLARANGRTIARISHSVREGDATRMEIRYIDADDSGIRQLADTHRLTLFTRDEYEAAFTQAGCTAEYIVSDRFAPGIFVGVRK
jgi:SAM-dependent methyltransferase